MNNIEAREILARELAPYRERSYEQLCSLAEGPKRVIQVVGPSGTTYQIDVSVYWDAKPHGNVRVIGSIDDDGLASVHPVVSVLHQNSRRVVRRGVTRGGHTSDGIGRNRSCVER